MARSGTPTSGGRGPYAEPGRRSRPARLRLPGLIPLFVLVSAGTVVAQSPSPRGPPASAPPVPVRTAAGQVVVPHVRDTLPLPAARVLLHRVGRDTQGPIDSVLTDPRGRFQFRFRADTAELYLLSARHGGIEYFSAPIRTAVAAPDTGIRLLAYDTSTTAAIALASRHLVVPRPGADGARAVLDLLTLRNDGLVARAVPDSTHPSWAMALPIGTSGMEVGESDLSPGAIVRDRDSVKVLAPLAPGEKKLLLQYAVPSDAGRLVIPAGPDGAETTLLVEETAARVSGDGLEPVDSQAIEGRTFRRWTGRPRPGGTITLIFAGGTRFSPRQLLAALVLPVAAALALAAWRLLGRRASGAETRSPDQLLDALAALDARYTGRQSDTVPEEWARYEADRAALKARLSTALAGGESTRYV